MIKQERLWWDPLSISCMIVMLFLASFSLEDTVWVADLNRVTTLALLGVTIGLALGQSQFNVRISFWLGLISSIEFLSWQVIFTSSGNVSWVGKASLLFIRIHDVLNQLVRNQPLQDGVLFFIAMTFLFWFLGLFSGYNLTRHGKPWITLLIAGAVIFIVQLFQPSMLRNNLLSAVYVFLFLFLNSRLKYLSSHLDWEKQHTAEDKETYSTINRFAILLALIIIIIAWNTPYLIKATTSGSKEQLELRDRFKGVWVTAENFFAPFKQKLIYQRGFLGDVLTLGTSRSTKEDLLFTVTPPSFDFYRNRYYWRGRYYERYQSGFWQNSGYSEEKLSANQTINPIEKTETKVGRFSVQVYTRQFSIFSPQIPHSINREITLLLSNNKEQRDVITIMPNRMLEPGEKYELNAAIINPFLEDLLAAKSIYPKWVTDAYLQLPQDISPRIQELSISLTQEKTNTYDKIQAITKYLRENLSYTDSINDLPLENSDPVEWFLFTKKSGFCTYFASAEVLLLRSIGIPARLVIGYAQGEPLDNGKVYEVHDKDNHAWPEVYFDGVGWIAFEPTPSQPIIDYLSVKISTNSEDQLNQESNVQQTAQPNSDRLRPNLWERKNLENLQEDSGEQFHINTQNLNTGYLIGIGIAFLFLLLIIIRLKTNGKPIPVAIETKLNINGITSPIWLTRWARYVQLFPIGKVFFQLDLMLILLGHNLNFADTPRQKVIQLQKIIPDGMAYLNQLLNEYERELFGPYQADLVIARKSIKAIWKLALMKWSMNFMDDMKKKFMKLFRR